MRGARSGDEALLTDTSHYIRQTWAEEMSASCPGPVLLCPARKSPVMAPNSSLPHDNCGREGVCGMGHLRLSIRLECRHIRTPGCGIKMRRNFRHGPVSYPGSWFKDPRMPVRTRLSPPLPSRVCQTKGHLLIPLQIIPYSRHVSPAKTRRGW